MIEFQDRIQKNPRLLRLKNPATGEIIDWEIQDLTEDEIVQEGTEINAEIFNKLVSQEDWATATLNTGVKASTQGYGGFKGIRYKKIGNRVYVNGSISATWDGSNILTIANLPEGYRPNFNCYALRPLTGVNIARIFVNTAGNLYLEWVRKIADGTAVTTELSWIDINIDFPVD